MTQYYPSSCDCIVDVELKKYLDRCNMHKNSRDVKECYSHNLQFTLVNGQAPNETNSRQSRIRLANEKKRIRNLGG